MGGDEEFAAQEPEKAGEFYEKVFGWKLQKWDGPQAYWLVTTGAYHEAGINGGILRRQEGFPGTINTIGVPSVDELVKKVTSHGGKVAMPKMTIPGVGYQAYCHDPGGNLFGIHQSDPSAK